MVHIIHHGDIHTIMAIVTMVIVIMGTTMVIMEVLQGMIFGLAEEPQQAIITIVLADLLIQHRIPQVFQDL